jgi:SAM-dependent methyltransferase
MIRQTLHLTHPVDDLMTHFPAWVAESATPQTLILDIGAGSSQLAYPLPIIEKTPHLIGVDPDPSLHQNPYLSERYPVYLEALAADPVHQGRYDRAFCIMVLEHIDHPLPFLSAVHKVLNPGGSFYGLTPRLWHYFGLTAALTGRLRVDQWVLHRMVGAEQATYHYPTRYRMNTARALTHQLDRVGFSSVEFRLFEQPNRYFFYLPRWLHAFPTLYGRIVYGLNASWIAGYVSFRAVRDPSSGVK